MVERPEQSIFIRLCSIKEKQNISESKKILKTCMNYKNKKVDVHFFLSKVS
jgi:hypothetical protein